MRDNFWWDPFMYHYPSSSCNAAVLWSQLYYLLFTDTHRAGREVNRQFLVRTLELTLADWDEKGIKDAEDRRWLKSAEAFHVANQRYFHNNPIAPITVPLHLSLRREFLDARNADPVQQEVSAIRRLIFGTCRCFTTKGQFVANLPMLKDFFASVYIQVQPYDAPVKPDPYFQSLYRDEIQLLTENLFLLKILPTS